MLHMAFVGSCKALILAPGYESATFPMVGVGEKPKSGCCAVSLQPAGLFVTALAQDMLAVAGKSLQGCCDNSKLTDTDDM